jgi:hypothetical protein
MEDARHIAGSGISWDTVVSETMAQRPVIAYLLLTRILAVQRASGVATPDIKNAWRRHGERLMPFLLADILGAGPQTVSSLLAAASRKAPIPSASVRGRIMGMRWTGALVEERKGRSLLLRLVDDGPARELSAARERFRVVGAIQEDIVKNG